MGYPMTYSRFVHRNRLEGDYEYGKPEDDTPSVRCSLVAGDLRRLERDTRDAVHLAGYAAASGLAVEQVKTLFDLFFEHGAEIYLRYVGDALGGLSPEQAAARSGRIAALDAATVPTGPEPEVSVDVDSLPLVD